MYNMKYRLIMMRIKGILDMDLKKKIMIGVAGIALVGGVAFADSVTPVSDTSSTNPTPTEYNDPNDGVTTTEPQPQDPMLGVTVTDPEPTDTSELGTSTPPPASNPAPAPKPAPAPPPPPPTVQQGQFAPPPTAEPAPVTPTPPTQSNPQVKPPTE